MSAVEKVILREEKNVFFAPVYKVSDKVKLKEVASVLTITVFVAGKLLHIFIRLLLMFGSMLK